MAKFIILIQIVLFSVLLFVQNSKTCKPSGIEDPVCGTDGITYRNSGWLFCINWPKNPSKILQ